nr:fgf-1 [Cnaphalocrocis medinalis granulovirus]
MTQDEVCLFVHVNVDFVFKFFVIKETINICRYIHNNNRMMCRVLFFIFLIDILVKQHQPYWCASSVSSIKVKNIIADLDFCITNSNNELTVGRANHCEKILFNIHNFEKNLIVMFKHTINKACQYLCIDKCGKLYYSTVISREDCVLTTAAFENIDTLSVHRGSYSDFLAVTNNYYITPMSFKKGDTLNRFYEYIELEYKTIDNTTTCEVTLSPTRSSRECQDSTPPRMNTTYLSRKNYLDYTWFHRALIYLGLKKYVIPTTNTLSFLEYNFTTTTLL